MKALSGRESFFASKYSSNAGKAIYLPVGLIHATYNIGAETLDFLAVLSPAKTGDPVTIEVSAEEPWKSLKP